MEKLLTIHQLGELMQVSLKTIYQWIKIDLIQFYKFPKGISFSEAEIQIWPKKRKTQRRMSYKLSI